jgi:hypothetical protein
MDVASRQGVVCGTTNDGGANLLVCLNLTASKRSDAGGTWGYARKNIAPLVLVEV